MPKTCPQCQTQAADDAAFCPSCGTSLSPAATATGTTAAAGAGGAAAAAAGAPAGSASTGSSLPAYRFDAARWTLADRIAGVATIVLFISLFLSWFSYSVGFLSASESGLSAHGYLYIVLILCIVIVAYLVLRAGWDEIPISTKIPHLTAMIVATVINLVLTIIAFIFKPSGGGFVRVGWDFGAVLALIAAIVAAAPYVIPPLREKTM
jgi:uncharacterized membrane protein YiaA